MKSKAHRESEEARLRCAALLGAAQADATIPSSCKRSLQLEYDRLARDSHDSWAESPTEGARRACRIAERFEKLGVQVARTFAAKISGVDKIARGVAGGLTAALLGCVAFWLIICALPVLGYCAKPDIGNMECTSAGGSAPTTVVRPVGGVSGHTASTPKDWRYPLQRAKIEKCSSDGSGIVWASLSDPSVKERLLLWLLICSVFGGCAGMGRHFGLCTRAADNWPMVFGPTVGLAVGIVAAIMSVVVWRFFDDSPERWWTWNGGVRAMVYGGVVVAAIVIAARPIPVHHWMLRGAAAFVAGAFVMAILMISESLGLGDPFFHDPGALFRIALGTSVVGVLTALLSRV